MHYRSPLPFAQGAAAQPTDGYALDRALPTRAPCSCCSHFAGVLDCYGQDCQQCENCRVDEDGDE